MNIIFLGCPGSGKGTQAKLFSVRNNFYHLSTGDLFREEILNNTEMGRKVKSYIENGRLVPDDLVFDLIKNKIKEKENNILFDGFPRTIEQAQGLERLMEEMRREIDIVFFFEVNEEDVIKRIVARRNCPECGRIYNLLTNPPAKDESCDVCRVKLVQRDDDREEIVRKRMEVYKDLTSPLISYYRTQGVFEIIDASKSIEEVYNQILSKISNRT